MGQILDATVSGTDSNSYLTVEDANELLKGFSPKIVDRWDALTDEEGNGEVAQEQLLIEGTRLIDQYRLWGPRFKEAEAQRLSFPRVTDAEGVIAEPVRLALAEYVVYKLDGEIEPLKRLQAEGVTNTSILGQSIAMTEDKSRLPAGTRNELDRLWNSHWPKGTEIRKIPGVSREGFNETGDSVFG